MLDDKYLNIINEKEIELKNEFEKIEKMSFINSTKVLNAFHKYNLSESDFNNTTGYGFNDIGRNKIEQIYSEIMGCEDALVRSQIVSGTHAITIGLFGILRYKDTMLSITGTPYDTIHEVIGIKENKSSLISHGIKYKEIDLINNDFDYNKIKKSLNNIKMVYIQRSRGYSTRDSLSIDKISKVIKLIKEINNNIIIFIDNCYTEFVEDKFPTEVGADIIAGSLIKNLGAGICSNGGYLAGKKELITLASERLNVPGEGKDIGPTKENKTILMGLYYSPLVIRECLKGNILISKVLNECGFNVSPKYNEKRCDIVQLLYLKNEENMKKIIETVQYSGAVDSFVKPVASPMPGYNCSILMASPSFTMGSSIELSCDGPVRKPYCAYIQGGISYDYIKYTLINILKKLDE